MKRQQKILPSLIAGILGTAINYSATATTLDVVDTASATAKTYASELSTPIISINDAFVTKLGAGVLSDSDAAIAPGDTSYVRLDFDNATVTTDASVVLGGYGGAAGASQTGFIYDASVGTAGSLINYGTDGIGATSSGYATAGGKQTTTGFTFYNASDTTCLGADSKGTGLVGTDGIKLVSPRMGEIKEVVFSLTEGGTAATTTPGTATTRVLAGCQIGFVISKVKVIDTTKPVTMTYSLHTNNVSASAPLTDPLSKPIAKKTGIPIANFGPALNYNLTAQDAVSDVAATPPFTKFKAGANATEYAANVGMIKLGFNTGVVGAGGTAFSALADLMTTSSKLDITGDFSSLARNAGKVYLSGSPTCGTSSTLLSNEVYSVPASASVGTSIVSLTLTSTGGLAANAMTGYPMTGYLCLEVANAGSTSGEIVSTDLGYAVKFSPANATNIKTFSPYNNTAGKIVRNGAELEAPYLSTSASFTNRILLTNFGTAPAKFSVKFQSDGIAGSSAVAPVPQPVLVATGNSAGKAGRPAYGNAKGGAEGEVPANSMLFINVPEQLVTFSSGNRGSAVFTFQADNKDIQGIVQTINTTTGEVTSIPMLRKGGGNGN
jgi:hypothetical protein